MGEVLRVSVGRNAVAIVDDDEAILDATCSLLESLGYDTVAFSSGAAFLDYDHAGDITRLLTDVHMPGMDGFELQKRVRADYPDMAVIMMTALSDDTVRRRALAGGARHLLRKPILADDLVRCLEGLEIR